MTQKNKKNKKPAVNNSCANVAEKNAKILADALNKVGIKNTISSYQPVWIESAKYRGEVTEVTMCDIVDNEGEPYSIMFKHSSGKPIFTSYLFQ